MLLLENFRLALFSLKANKMRSLLTMLGIIIGISSVIAIMTIGDSLSSSLTSEMSSIGANNLEVGIQYRQLVDEDGYVYYDDAPLTEDDLLTKEMIDNYYETYKDKIKALAISRNLGSGVIEEGKMSANVDATGVNLGGLYLDKIELLSGRYFTERELQSGIKVAIVSEKTVSNLYKGDNEAAIGKNIEVNIDDKAYNFNIIGVYKYEQQSFGGLNVTDDRNLTTTMYIPIKTATDLRHLSAYTNFTVMVEGGVDPNEFSKETKRFFNRFYERNEHFEISAFSLASMVESMMKIMNTVTLGISFIAGIALLVGGIGVMNIMLVSITERTREIGTRKALGAPNASIRVQFIIESVVICIIGGIIGIIIGCILGMAVATVMKAPAVPSVRGILISLTFSMAIGVFFGYYPANKAAKMDPIEALRYE